MNRQAKATIVVSYQVGAGFSFPWVKQPGGEGDHSPPASAEAKKIWIYTSTPIRLHSLVLNWLSTGITFFYCQQFDC
jgi:hypothetical protein